MCYNNGSGDIGSDMIMGGKGERGQIDLLENEDTSQMITTCSILL